MDADHIDVTATPGTEGTMNITIQVPASWIGVPLRIRVEPDELAQTELTAKERHARGLAAMERLAARGGLGIEDPVAWQREIRKDRPLPGRE